MFESLFRGNEYQKLLIEKNEKLEKELAEIRQKDLLAKLLPQTFSGPSAFGS